MEFFARLEPDINSAELQQHLTIAALPRVCESIDNVMEDHGSSGRIYCIWGEFAINRELIKGGVRFSLPGCPNNLAWTVTTDLPPVEEQVVIHLTVNRQQLDEDFKESIDMFVADLQQGIAQYFTQLKAAC